MDIRETAELFNRVYGNVHKAVDHRPEPREEARQLITQIVARAFTSGATRSVLEGVNPTKLARPDGVHQSLVKILADVLVEPIT